MKYILLPLTFVFFFSCAQESKTSAKVSVRLAQALNAEFAGSLVLMGKNTQTQQTFFREVGQNGISIELDNGTWDFAAMGWEGDPAAPTNFTGKAFCDVKPNLVLSGGEINLQFSATSQKCGHAVFGGANAADPTNGFKQFIVNSCIDIKNSLNSFANGNSPEDKGCGKTGGGTPVPEFGSERYLDGTHQYFKISMFGKNLNGSFSFPISSGCISKIQLKAANSQIRLPRGSGALPISYQIESFYNDPNCSGDKLTYTFINGFYQRDTGLNAYVHNDNNQNTDAQSDSDLQLEAFLHEPGCTNPEADPNVGGSTTIFEGFSLAQHSTPGNPASDSKYLICHKSQLVQINVIDDKNKATYFLGVDLLDIGFDTIAVPDFLGSFRGDGHSIQGATNPLFQKIKSINDTVPSAISDIFIVDSTIEIYDDTAYGALAKEVKAEGSSKLEIENIKVNETSTIREQSSLASDAGYTAGGLIGIATNLSLAAEGLVLKNVHSKATIDTRGSAVPTVALSIGGLIGFVSDQVLIQDSSFQGDLILEDLGSSPSISSGGLIGKVGSSTNEGPTLERVYVNIRKLNETTNYQQAFGGLVGSLSQGKLLTVRDSLVKTSNPPLADFLINDYVFYSLIGSASFDNTVLEVDGFLADVQSIEPKKLQADYYMVPSLSNASSNLTLGNIITDTNTFFEKIAIIHPNLDDNSLFGFGPTEVKRFDNVADITSGFFYNSPTWNLDAQNNNVTLNFEQN